MSKTLHQSNKSLCSSVSYDLAQHSCPGGHWLSYLLEKLIYFLYFLFLALLYGLRDLRSLTRNWTRAPGCENAVLTIGPPGMSLIYFLSCPLAHAVSITMVPYFSLPFHFIKTVAILQGFGSTPFSSIKSLSTDLIGTFLSIPLTLFTSFI